MSNIPTLLIQEASNLVGKFRLNVKDNDAGGVASALITKKGNIYTGICMNITCGIGFCAEAAAISEMLKNRETEIAMIVAVHYANKHIIPPCGRCRELIYQINKNNLNTKVITAPDRICLLSELLPETWISDI